MHLLKLTQSEDPKIKANCARTLKNMTSDSTEALEEGAVANLIAMSLEGKEKTIFHEELTVPDIRPPTLKDKAAPECITDVIEDAFWFEDKVRCTLLSTTPSSFSSFFFSFFLILYLLPSLSLLYL